MMTTAVVQQNLAEPRPRVPPSALLIGKKCTLDYVAPALYRINNTDELRVATGELKRMLCIEIHLIKINPIVVAQPAVGVHMPVETGVIEIPEAAPDVAVAVEVPVVVAEKKQRSEGQKEEESHRLQRKNQSRRRKNRQTRYIQRTPAHYF
jgi:hypothetical protein